MTSVSNMPMGQRVTKTMPDMCTSSICSNTRQEYHDLRAEMRVLRACFTAIEGHIDRYEQCAAVSKMSLLELSILFADVRSVLAKAKAKQNSSERKSAKTKANHG